MTHYFAIIQQDDFPENPRDDWDTVGTLYTWHRNYRLGGKDDFNNQNHIDNLKVWCFDKFDELANLKELEGYNSYEGCIYFEDEELTFEQQKFFDQVVNTWIKNNICILPVYMYDHSGITISTGPFSCPWDSGQVGMIYITKDTCKKHQIQFEDAEDILKGEIKTLDQYLTGDVWSYTIYSTDDENFANEIFTEKDNLPDEYDYEDGCGGFFGFDYCENVTKESLTYYSTKT